MKSALPNFCDKTNLKKQSIIILLIHKVDLRKIIFIIEFKGENILNSCYLYLILQNLYESRLQTYNFKVRVINFRKDCKCLKTGRGRCWYKYTISKTRNKEVLQSPTELFSNGDDTMDIIPYQLLEHNNHKDQHRPFYEYPLLQNQLL